MDMVMIKLIEMKLQWMQNHESQLIIKHKLST